MDLSLGLDRLGPDDLIARLGRAQYAPVPDAGTELESLSIGHLCKVSSIDLHIATR
jgi:hypothetical protein